jgi:hypothetical protein
MPIRNFLESAVGTVAAPVVAGVNSVTSSFTNLGSSNNPLAPLTDPITSRLRTAGLMPGGVRSGPASTQVNFFNAEERSAIPKDWKVKITLSKSNPFSFMTAAEQSILKPLMEVNGVVYPYTPQITVTNQTNYNPQRFTHSNYAHLAYESSEVQAIQITGDFTAQTRAEADYVLDCIYFFRAASKMYFGESKGAGQPPPLVYLNGYGKHYFPNVPCLITTFSHTMPAEVDYMETSDGNQSGGTVDLPNGRDSVATTVGQTTRIPTTSSITVNLQPVYSKSNLNKFNLQDFANGKLLDKGFI